MMDNEDDSNLRPIGKRNFLPSDEDEKLQTQARTRAALDRLFESIGQTKHITYESQGHYDDLLQLVKIPTLKNVPLGLGKQNKDGIFLSLYEALFCFEAELVLILYNQVPLSLAEAYHLFLRTDRQFKEYIVFQKMTTAGFCVLPHSPISSNCQQQKIDKIPLDANNEVERVDISPLIGPGDCDLTMEAILAKLRLNGPNELQSSTYDTDCGVPAVTFDIYVKDTFVKNKPRRDIPGKPDYHIVIASKCDQPPTMVVDMMNNDAKIIFAIVDDTGSVCLYNISAHDAGVQTFELWKESIEEF